VPTDRPRRLRPLSSGAIENAAVSERGSSDAELYQRLEEALAALPRDERAAAMVAFGLAEGSSGVAGRLGLSDEDAEALSRSALQLLRGALGDLDPDAPDVPARLSRRRRRIGNHRPGDDLIGG
jgi:DNA-directed RNA polymerase specialized sigma24 family protein